MAKQYRIQRKVASIPIVAGGFNTQDLPRGYDYEAIFFRISASVQVTVLATSVRAEAPCQLVPRVEIIADGKNNAFSAPFWATSLGAIWRPLAQSGARAVTPPSGVAVATYAVEAIGVVDLASIDGVRPKDSNLRTRGLSLLQARLTFGQPGDVFVGGTVNFSGSPVVDVFTAEIVEETDAQGNFLTSPLALRKTSYQELALTASNANQEVRLPAGNLIKSALVRTDGSTTAGEPSTAVLNNLQIANGVDVRINLSGAQLRAKNNADYGQITAGYYMADVTRKGEAGVSLSDLWDVSLAAEPKLILDVTGGANVKLQVVTTEYIPLGAM
jgi:hypothetical protein